MNWRAEYGPSAVVTGASAGLGAEYASQLAARGLDLVLIARREERLEALAERLRAEHRVQVRTLALDLLAEDSTERLQALAAEQEVGLLINNAGFSYSGHFLDADPDTYRRMTRLNCELPTLLAQIFLRPMVERGRGGMILLASMSAFQATPYCTVYGASKGFDLLLGEGLAVELADTGLTLQTVCPGSTSTELQTVAGVPEDYVEKRMTPRYVVERSLQTFGRLQVLIPSRKQALLVFLQRFGSRGVAARIAGSLLRRRLR